MNKILILLLAIVSVFSSYAPRQPSTSDCSGQDSKTGDACICENKAKGRCQPRGCPSGKKLCCNCRITNLFNNQEIVAIALQALENFWANPENRTHWVVRLKNVLNNELRLGKDSDYWKFADQLPAGAKKIEVVDNTGCTDMVSMFPTDRSCTGLKPESSCKCPNGKDGFCWISKIPQTVNGENITSHTLFCNCV